MRLIAVAMGEPDSQTRNAEITSLLDYAFAQYEVNSLLKNNILGEYKVDKAKKQKVKIVPLEEANILKKKTEKEIKYTYDTKINEIKAPVKKGDVIGKLVIKNKNKQIKTIKLTVDENVKKANLLELYGRYLKELITGNIVFK